LTHFQISLPYPGLEIVPAFVDSIDDDMRL